VIIFIGFTSYFIRLWLSLFDSFTVDFSHFLLTASARTSIRLALVAPSALAIFTNFALSGAVFGACRPGAVSRKALIVAGASSSTANFAWNFAV